MKKKKILVPIDYTPSSVAALEHADKLASKMDAGIVILHIVVSPEDVAQAQRKLAEFTARAVQDSLLTVSHESHVVVGDVEEEIGSQAEEQGVMMVVMGNHGMKGLQFITGSHSLKIVSHAQVPFIIVQENGISDDGYQNIVTPMDLHKQTKLKLEIIARLAMRFDSTVHLLAPYEKDEFLHNALERNMHYAQNYLEEREVSYTTRISSENQKHLDKAIITRSAEVGADLIAIMNWGDVGILDVFGEHITERIINNKEMTPVLVLNPRNIGDFEIFGWPTP